MTMVEGYIPSHMLLIINFQGCLESNINGPGVDLPENPITYIITWVTQKPVVFDVEDL